MGSNSTYRDKQAEVCHQKLIRDRVALDPKVSALFPQPDEIILKKAIVRQISRKIAWKVISRYEWLGTLPACSYFFGVFFDDYVGGVCCIDTTQGAGVSVNMQFGVDRGELAYVCRGACVHWAPKGTAPKLLNRAINMVPNTKCAIAYSDTDAGEIGTVYQAAGWCYIGKGTKNWEWLRPNGTVANRNTSHQIAKRHNGRYTWREVHAKLIEKGWKPQPVNRKHKYVVVTKNGKKDKELVRRVNAMSLPYPKRANHAPET